MSRSYVKILLTLFITPSIVAQLSPVTWNGCQKCQNINSNSNFPVSINNGFINGQQNGFAQLSGCGQQITNDHHNRNLLNELQSIPKLSFVNGQITDIIDFASKINKRQLTDNNNNDPVNYLPSNNPYSQVNDFDQAINNEQLNNVPITCFSNTVAQNNVDDLLSSNPYSQTNCLDQNFNHNQVNNVPITFFPKTVNQKNLDNFQSSNPCSQVNFIDQSNAENQLNNVPINFYPNLNPGIENNLVPNNVATRSCVQNNPVLNHFAPNTAVPISFYPNIGPKNVVPNNVINDIPNTVIQHNLDNLQPSNNCPQVNFMDQGSNNNQLNNVPINFYPNLNPVIENNIARSNCAQNNPVFNNFVPNTAVPISFYPNIGPQNIVPTNFINNILNNVDKNNVFPIVSNVSPCNNGINTNNYQQNLLAPCSTSLVDLTKINSLILTGEACNNGQPFSVLPANSFNAQDFSIYNDIVDNGYKITRSLPTETSHPANIEKNVIPAQNNNPYNEAAIPLHNKMIGKLIPANINLANNNQDASLNNGQLAVIGNNIYYNKQLISSQQQSVNQWQPPANQNIPTATNWPAINTNSQLTGNLRPEMTNNFNLADIANIPDVANYNLPDLANINLLNLGELGTLPIFSGLPVIGITETVSVVDPEQLKQNHV